MPAKGPHPPPDRCHAEHPSNLALGSTAATPCVDQRFRHQRSQSTATTMPGTDGALSAEVSAALFETPRRKLRAWRDPQACACARFDAQSVRGRTVETPAATIGIRSETGGATDPRQQSCCNRSSMSCPTRDHAVRVVCPRCRPLSAGIGTRIALQRWCGEVCPTCVHRPGVLADRSWLLRGEPACSQSTFPVTPHPTR